MATLSTVNVKYGPKPIPVADRFWSKVRVLGADDCWEWQAYRNPRGYGTIGAGGHGRGNLLAHRVAYEMANGAIPDGMDVCHHCDNPPCVNAHHLFAGTAADNMRDCAEKARTVRGERQKAARLTADIIPLIRAAASTESMNAIARRFNVSRFAIRSVIYGRTWRWVP